MRTRRAIVCAAAVAVAALAAGCAPSRLDVLRELPLSEKNYRLIPVIRVLLVKDAQTRDNITIAVSGGCDVFRYDDQHHYGRVSRIKSGTVVVDKDSVRIGKKVFEAGAIEIVPGRSPRSYCSVNGVAYDGNIAVVGTGKGHFKIVNALDLETYLKSVVPSEIPRDWPMASLRAQAIAARTYALYKMETVQDPAYDVVGTIHDQAYMGRVRRVKSTDRAVDDTFSVVLLWRGKLFPAYFHSCCGGHTENVHNVWPTRVIPKDFPPLAGRDTSVYLDSKHQDWKRVFSAKDIERKLAAKDIETPGITNIVLEEMTAGGRPQKVLIEHKGGPTRLGANAFRLAVGAGASGLKSMKLRVYKEGPQFTFLGDGFGHGVGMSQYGARAMARSDKDCLEILDFFYPESEAMRVYEIPQ